jgi:hypothetical protein
MESALLWDPETNEFGYAGSLLTARSGLTATLLPEGRVLRKTGATFSTW